MNTCVVKIDPRTLSVALTELEPRERGTLISLLAPMMRRVALTAEQRAVVHREEVICAYCGAADGPFDVDHIYPASRGGTNHRRNLTLACVACNSAKRDMVLPAETEEQNV